MPTTKANVRDRVKELRRVRARDLVPNPKNWREHPPAQRNAPRALLSEIGFADVVLAVELPDQRLMTIDGHLRADEMGDEEIPVAVLDLTPAEADKLMATLDPLAAMAEANAEALQRLVAELETDSEAV